MLLSMLFASLGRLSPPPPPESNRWTRPLVPSNENSPRIMGAWPKIVESGRPEETVATGYTSGLSCQDDPTDSKAPAFIIGAAPTSVL